MASMQRLSATCVSLALFLGGDPEAREGWRLEAVAAGEPSPAEHGPPALEADSEFGQVIRGLDGFDYAIVKAPGGRVWRKDQEVQVRGAGVLRYNDGLLEVYADDMRDPVALELLDTGELVVLEATGELRHAARGSRHGSGGLPAVVKLAPGKYTGLVHAPATFGVGDGLIVSSLDGAVRTLEIIERGSTFVVSAERPLLLPSDEEPVEVTGLSIDETRGCLVVSASDQRSWRVSPLEPAVLPERKPFHLRFSHGDDWNLHFDAHERWLRRDAIESLHGDLAIEVVLGALREGRHAFDSENARSACIWLLGRSVSGEDEEAEIVAHFLENDSSSVRALAIRVLSDSFLDVLPDLDPLLADPAAGVRREAAYVIGLSGRTASAPALLAALKLWDDAPLRFTIRQALARVGGFHVVAVRLLQDYNPEWQNELFLVFEDTRDPRAADALAGIATHPEAHHTLRARALRQLAKLDAGKARWDGRASALEAYTGALSDLAPSVRLIAVAALEIHADEAALERASEVLARERNAEVREALERLLRD